VQQPVLFSDIHTRNGSRFTRQAGLQRVLVLKTTHNHGNYFEFAAR